MKQNINIRSMEEKQKIGNYRHIRGSITESAIAQIEKRAIHSPQDFEKVSTTKDLREQLHRST